MSTTTTSTSTTLRTRKSFGRSLRKPVAASASTPDLNAAFTAHSRLSAALSRKTSLAALTPTTLASIPDVSETYALESVLNDSNMIPATPGRPGEDVTVGDAVEVPGGLHGTVRFVGSVQGKKGQFVGIELNREFAARGKNNGDVDGLVDLRSNQACNGALMTDKLSSAAFPTSIPVFLVLASSSPSQKPSVETRPALYPILPRPLPPPPPTFEYQDRARHIRRPHRPCQN